MKSICAVSIFLMATTASARIDFHVTRAGKPLRGSEICFFASSVHPHDPYQRMFVSGDVTCLPADQLLEIPEGAWLYFARHRAGFVSGYAPLVRMPRDESAENFKTVEEEVVPAGTVRVSEVLPQLESGQRLVMLAESEFAGTIVLPLVPGEDSILVPANAVVVPTVIEDHKPTRLGTAMKLVPGQTVELEPIPSPRSDVHDVVGWISFPSAIQDATNIDVNTIEPPRLRLNAGNESFVTALRVNGAALAETLLIFKDVPRRPATVRLSGPLWMSDAVGSSGLDDVELLQEPLSTEPAAAIGVTFTLPPELDRDCGNVEREASLSLSFCAGANDSCEVTQKRVLADTKFETFEGLRPGRYAIVLDPGVAGARQREEIVGVAGTTTQIVMNPTYFSFHGYVRLGADPVARKLDFWGRGTTVSDAIDGRYSVTLSQSPPPSLRLIRIEDCDHEHAPIMHVATSIPREGQRFDITIPDNAITVKLLAAPAAGGLHGSAGLTAYEDETGDHTQFSRGYPADEAGGVTIRNVTIDAPLSICGMADGYETRCTPRFHLGATEKRQIELRLSKKNMHRGHVAATGSIEFGRLWWVNEDGIVSETVEVNPDGDFAYELRHAATERVVMASATQPLALLSTSPGSAEVLDLAYPFAGQRDVQVGLKADSAVDRAVLGLILGNVVIPTDAFSYHQQFHGAQYVVDRGKSVVISAVQALTPLVVVLGPETHMLEQLPAGKDWMSIAAFRLSRPRLQVPPSGVVMFD